MNKNSKSFDIFAGDKSQVAVMFAGMHEHLQFNKLLKECEHHAMLKAQELYGNYKEAHCNVSWMIVDYGDCFIMECRGDSGSVMNLLITLCRMAASVTTCKVLYAKDCCDDIIRNNEVNEFVEYGCAVIDKIPPIAMENITTSDISDMNSVTLDIISRLHSMINTISSAPQDKRAFTAENLRLSNPKAFPAHDLIVLFAEEQELLSLREYLELNTAPLQFELDCEVNHPVDDPLKY